MSELEHEFLTIPDVAAYLGVTVATIYRYIHDKANPLPFIKISRSTLRINKKELDIWIFNFRKNDLKESN